MDVYYDKIKKLLRAKRLNIGLLCEQAKINRTTYWRWVKGSVPPNKRKVRRIAEILDVSIDTISDLMPEKVDKSSSLDSAFNAWKEFALFDAKGPVSVLNSMSEGLVRLNEDVTNMLLIIKGLLTSTHMSFYIKDAELKFIAANSEFMRMFSLPASYTVKGKCDDDFFSHKESKVNSKEDAKVVEKGVALKDKEMYIPGTRKKRWGIVSKIPIKDAEGYVLGLIGVFIDITDRKRSEKTRELLEYLINVSSIGVSIRERKTDKLLYRNMSQEILTGYSNEEMSKFSYEELTNKIVYPEYRHKFNNKLFEQENELRFEYKLRTRFGADKWCEINKSLIKFNEIECIASISKDITQKKELEGVQQLIYSLLESYSDAVTVYSITHDKYTFINGAKSQIFGYPKEAFLNDTAFRIKYCIHKDYIDSEKEFKRNFSWPQYRKYKIVRPDNDVRTIAATTIYKTINNEKLAFYLEKDVTVNEKNVFLNIFKMFLEESNSSVEFMRAKKTSDDNQSYSYEELFNNRKVEKIFGYPQRQVSDYEFWINNIVHPDDRQNQAYMVKSNSLPSERVYRIIKPDGNVHFLRNTRWITDVGNEIYLAVINKDITDEMLRERKAVKKEVNAEKQRIAQELIKCGVSSDIVKKCTEY